MSSHLRRQGGTSPPEPVGCLLVELVPCKFVHDEATTRAQEAADLIEDHSQASNVMERQARYRDVETGDFVQIFDPALAEDPTIRGPRVDCHDVITTAV